MYVKKPERIRHCIQHPPKNPHVDTAIIYTTSFFLVIAIIIIVIITGPPSYVRRFCYC